ncbi:MAG: hypothetical protein CVT89_01565 [Candidatus Altiarchaeales archaeon HGW-Altiarchaeales-2]|nr:MAG: hypothetical protein CVT89_01565 [Candidatus Altiarchaeales archaeon HGW-Altiarchaeales-2]
MKKQVWLFLLVICCAIFLLIFGSLQHNNQSQPSFLDDLFGFIFGTEESGEIYGYISCQPDFIIFNVSLNKGEMYRYKEVLFGEDEGIVLNSSYFIKEYNMSTKCYTIEYKTQTITGASSYQHYENSRTGENITLRNITIANDNGTYSLCNNEHIICRAYMYRESSFFGLIDKNLKIIATSKKHVKYRWGIYSFEGDFYPKTNISVDGEQKLNNRDVYVIKRVVETVEKNKKNVSIGILSTSYFWIDKNTGMLIKQVDYNSNGDKTGEIQLINS